MTGEKPRRALGEIEKTYREVKARLAREGRTNISWYDDKELFDVLMEMFNHYQHYWMPTRPGGKVLTPLCIRIERRGGKPNEDGRPMCPGCARKRKGDWR